MTNFVQKSFAQFGRPDRNSSDDASGSPQKHLSPKKNPFGGNKIKVSHEPLNRKPSGVVHEQEDEGSSRLFFVTPLGRQGEEKSSQALSFFAWVLSFYAWVFGFSLIF